MLSLRRTKLVGNTCIANLNTKLVCQELLGQEVFPVLKISEYKYMYHVSPSKNIIINVIFNTYTCAIELCNNISYIQNLWVVSIDIWW